VEAKPHKENKKKVCFRATYLAVVAVEFLEELLPTRRS